MKCPYCAEQIQADAKKCRFCGEWLTSKPTLFQGSTDARAVAKGIKKQKQDEAEQRALVLLSLVFGVVVGSVIGGTLGWFVGLVILLGGCIWSAVRYHKE